MPAQGSSPRTQLFMSAPQLGTNTPVWCPPGLLQGLPSHTTTLLI